MLTWALSLKHHCASQSCCHGHTVSLLLISGSLINVGHNILWHPRGIMSRGGCGSGVFLPIIPGLVVRSQSSGIKWTRHWTLLLPMGRPAPYMCCVWMKGIVKELCTVKVEKCHVNAIHLWVDLANWRFRLDLLIGDTVWRNKCYCNLLKHF